MHTTIPTPVEKLFINGEYTLGKTTDRYDVISPATGEQIAALPVPTAADLDAAITAARAAQREWRKLSVADRAKICHRVGDKIAEHVAELAALQTLEQGKPLAESIADISEAAELFHLHAEDALRLFGETIPSTDPQKVMYTWHQAVGTWAIITPWNFPFLMFAEFAAPGLATGNALVVKPPTHTSLTVLKAMELLVEAGVPAGLVNILPGEGDFGAKLVAHPGIDAIGFIGSSATGAKIQALAGLKRSVMECSGNGPVVVLEDANMQRAAKAAVDSAFYCGGQVCCATERVIVHKDAQDAFLEAAIAYATDTVKLGDPFGEGVNLGCLNNEAVAAKMDRHLAEARDRGFDIVMGGGRADGFATNLFYEFTIVNNVAEDSLLSREESFGPVLPIIVAENDDDALRIANADALGLQSAVFTNDINRGFRFLQELETGQVLLNESNGWWDINMPFGGAGGKGTGWGRIGGIHTLRDMTDLRTSIIHIGD
ncbi:aldehyde dehydrogenase family protein [Canibacter oris]|uniref:Succinate-semialdehyde dehydrogenase/glutarate-semialdehyde dehydrogenase n=1 Tax=Canibacter oris TaxID=1365628 RepID=A0A840DEJ9_9MICO|nr:aldehyde dehydrogenase family protein [Canibacter oris]MBB4071080.1 succinate-semialdehyde dehydrogenase/glutarate-semialdehyde dehydrogenase [Canibacter oris]